MKGRDREERGEERKRNRGERRRKKGREEKERKKGRKIYKHEQFSPLPSSGWLRYPSSQQSPEHLTFS